MNWADNSNLFIVIFRFLSTPMPRKKPPAPGLGTTLRTAREARDLTLREAAAKIGCSYPVLSRVERGETQLRSGDLARACLLYKMTLTSTGLTPETKTAATASAKTATVKRKNQ